MEISYAQDTRVALFQLRHVTDNEELHVTDFGRVALWVDRTGTVVTVSVDDTNRPMARILDAAQARVAHVEGEPPTSESDEAV
jgi:hypothetical protein